MVRAFGKALHWFKGLPIWIRVGSLSLFMVAAGITVLIGFVAYQFSPRHMCGSHGSREFLSPDGRYKAVLYEYDCGATTDFGTHIAVIAANKRFDPYDTEDRGLIFTADSDHQAVEVDSEGMLPVGVRWINASFIRVDIPGKARVFKENRKIGPISVDYTRTN